jgi:hypothetical protein
MTSFVESAYSPKSDLRENKSKTRKHKENYSLLRICSRRVGQRAVYKYLTVFSCQGQTTSSQINKRITFTGQSLRFEAFRGA